MKRFMVVAAILFVAGCTNAARAQYGGLGSNFKVTLYSGGEAVREWHSTGKVLTETDSDGWYFMDKSNNKLVRISGSVAIEQE